MAFAGFDRSSYPGDALMTKMIAVTNLRFCGYYLFPAPSHTTDGSWMGKRAFLQGLGWGLAPLYLGQQTQGPGSHHPSAAQGTIDGNDAVSLMKKEGFPIGSHIYLDLENSAPLPPILGQYVAAWCTAVEAANYKSGVYATHAMIPAIQAIAPNARIWAIFVTTTIPHTVPGPPFSEKDPSGSGVPDAFLWQCEMAAEISIPGEPGTLSPVDMDTAKSANPLV